MHVRSLCLMLLLALTLAVPRTATADAGAPLLLFDSLVRGGLVVTGNALGLSKAAGANEPGERGSIGAFMSLNEELQVGTFPARTTLDWQENGSRAALNPPNGSRIIYAELFWGGSHRSLDQDVSSQIDSAVRFRTPLTSAQVSPSAETAREVDTGLGASFYLRSAEVTALVQAAGPGFYSVEGVPATVGPLEDSFNAAGWWLAVVWERDDAPERSVTLVSDARWIGPDEATAVEQPRPCLPETQATSPLHVTLAALEGDADISGVQVRVGPSGASVGLSGPENPALNFFASQINDSEGVATTTGTFASRRHRPGAPLPGGRQGLDLTRVRAPSVPVPGGAPLRIGFATAEDAFLWVLAGVEADVPEAVVDRGRVAEASLTRIAVGQEATLTFPFDLAASELGVDRVEFEALLPSGVSVVPGSVVWRGTTLPDADLVGGVPLGAVEAGDVDELVFTVRVDSLPSPASLGTLPVRARWTWELDLCPGREARSWSWLTPSVVLITPHLSAQLTRVGSGLLEPEREVELVARVSNPGSAAMRGNLLRLEVPQELEYLAGSTRIAGRGVADPAPGQRPFAELEVLRQSGETGDRIGVDEEWVVRQRFVIAEGSEGLLRAELTLIPTGGEPYDTLVRGLNLDVVDCERTPERCAQVPPPTVPGEPGEGAVCGNGRIEGNEECDDGNLSPGDGCDARCRVEPGWTCTGQPSVCTPLCAEPPCEEESTEPTEPTEGTESSEESTFEPPSSSEAPTESSPTLPAESDPPEDVSGGCACATGTGPAGGLPVVLAFGVLLAGRLRRGESAGRCASPSAD